MRNSQTLFFRNASQLLTLAGGPAPRRGRALAELGIVRDGGVLVADGMIVKAGRTRDLAREAKRLKALEIDCRSRVVMPGLVDSHTHLVFAGSRLGDFEQRIRGKTGREIARAGGGILFSARQLAQASQRDLLTRASRFLEQAALFGTTTIEIKSGYGLDVPDELKTLRVIRQLMKASSIEIVPTLLVAHALPRRFRGRKGDYVRFIIQNLIPEAGRRRLAECIDCFCDPTAFDHRQCRRILEAGAAFGMTPRVHADQTGRSGGTQLAVSVAAASADHLDHASPGDIEALARSNVVATLLPGANFFFDSRTYPPARALIEAGAAVALATDFNPGTCPTLNLQFIMSLSCTAMKMTPAEAIAASTINAAYSLRRADRLGSIEAGKQADLIVMGVDDYRKIPYFFAANHCVLTVRQGQVIASRLKQGSRGTRRSRSHALPAIS
jgi:imidazolonepropionase